MTFQRQHALVLAALLVFAASSAAAGPPEVTVVVGEVDIGIGEPPVWHAAQVGERLQAGNAIRIGSDSRAELMLSKGTIRLYEDSLLRLPSGAFGMSETQAVELEEGGALFDIDKNLNREGFEVRTPEAVVMVKGTRFSVEVEGTRAAVAVFRGLVGVRSLVDTLEHEVLVRQGFTAVRGRAAGFELRFDRTPDPWKTWKKGGRRALPRLRATQPPAKIALEESSDAAMQQVKGARLKQAMENDPKLKKKMAKQLKAQLSEAVANGAISSELAQELLERHQAPNLDPLTQAPDEEVAMSMEGSIAEEVLNAGAVPGSVLEITRVTSGGPNLLEFTDPSGAIVASMLESDIDLYLQTGNLGLLPPALVNYINTSGVAPKAYMEMLEEVYF